MAKHASSFYHHGKHRAQPMYHRHSGLRSTSSSRRHRHHRGGGWLWLILLLALGAVLAAVMLFLSSRGALRFGR